MNSKNWNSCVIFKKMLHIFIAVLCVTQFSFAQSQVVELTQENYLDVVSATWVEYVRWVVTEYHNKHPEKKDDLNRVIEQISVNANKKSIETAFKYGSIPDVLEAVFSMRIAFQKDVIFSVLKTLPDSMQNSPYGKGLLYHINTEQITEGSKYYNFQATNIEGESFTLSSLEGKNILLVYGGLHCMGESGRNDLTTLYEQTDRNNFEIVFFGCCSSLDELKKISVEFSSLKPNYIFVSDFLNDINSVAINYGCQSTPTCFFINREGLVVMKTLGVVLERITEFLK